LRKPGADIIKGRATRPKVAVVVAGGGDADPEALVFGRRLARVIGSGPLWLSKA
jgi:hypothetical protein